MLYAAGPRKITKTNENQIEPKQNKPKLKAKQPTKKKTKKSICQKRKEMLTHKNGPALLVKKLGTRVK